MALLGIFSNDIESRVFSEMFAKNDTKTNLINLRDEVQGILSGRDLNVPFFIAGGSIFSILNKNTNFDDVDVYFYDEKSMNKVYNTFKHKAEIDTRNALTIQTKMRQNRYIKIKTQFIKLKVGTPQELFDTFDLNCSKVAFTSDGQLIKDDTYSTNIRADISNFNIKTLSRMNKYINDKGADDIADLSRYEIYDYLIKNPNEEFKVYYESGGRKKEYGYRILNPEIFTSVTDSRTNISKRAKYCHDKIVKLYKPEDRIELFEKIYGIGTNHFDTPSEELLVQQLVFFNDGDVKEKKKNIGNHWIQFLNSNPEIKDKIKSDYAEYFI